jgi:uncharacterized protein involved in exopolysaccharide biosynthesis
VAVFFVLYICTFAATHTSADTASDLQNQIDSSNSQIQALKDEIAQLQTQLNDTTKQKQTLQTAVSAT